VFADIPAGCEVGRYHSLIAEPDSMPDDARGQRAHPEGEIMGVRHRTADGRGRAVSSRERADAGRPGHDAQFPASSAADSATMTDATPVTDVDAWLRALLDRLLDGEQLSEPTAAQLLSALTAEALPPALAGALLAALRAKGVTAPELRGFAAAMRALARRPQLPASPALADAVDIVGTGGDRSGSLNLSTGAALLAAACGVPVVKHGNRAVSSRAGSADVLQALGLPMPLDEAAAGRCFAALGFTFLFAPYYHPATAASRRYARRWACARCSTCSAR
jgi:hypothetical protein